MFSIKTYHELYSELIDVIKGISFRPNRDILYDEINLQMAVLNGQRAISEHGRDLVLSNLREIANRRNPEQYPLWDIASKELFILELSKDIDWH